MRRALAIGLVLAATLSGCGGGSARTPSTAPVAALPPLLAPAAVPGLATAQTRTLDAAAMAHDVASPPLAGLLSGWGLARAGERTYQGKAAGLTLVLTRTVDFRTAAGAAAFVAYVRSHAGTFFGGFPTLKPLQAGARSGFVALPQPCACHMANPALVAVARRGARVSWLEINGPEADAALLRRLLAEAP